MVCDAERNICNILQNVDFTILLDESTLSNHESVFLAYLRLIHNRKIHQQLLLARSMETDTKKHLVFNTVKQFFLRKNIVVCPIDSAASMLRRYRGFIAFLKREVPNVTTIHCIVHRQHVVARNINPRLNTYL